MRAGSIRPRSSGTWCGGRCRGSDWSPRSGRSGLTLVRDLGDGRRLVRTPRYEAYSDILRGWAKDGTEVVEIAGNRRILTTVTARTDARLDVPGATPIFTIPIQARPGWQRIGFDTGVPAIMAAIQAVERQGATFEHAYDY